MLWEGDNWVDVIEHEITRIAKSDRPRFIRACVRLITVQNRVNPDIKVSPPLGFGPDDFLRVCNPILQEIELPTTRFRQFNPFKDLFLEEDLPKDYILYRSRRELIVKTIFFVKVAYELYQGIVETLYELGVPAFNTKLALHRLRFEIFRKGIIPFAITTGELLRRQRLLHTDLEHMYLKFMSLCTFFQESILDDELALPTTTGTTTAPLQPADRKVA